MLGALNGGYVTAYFTGPPFTEYTKLALMLILKQMATEDVVYSARSTGANQEYPDSIASLIGVSSVF